MRNIKRNKFIYSLIFSVFIFTFYLLDRIKAGEILTISATIIFTVQVYNSLNYFKEYYSMEDNGDKINKLKEEKMNNFLVKLKNIAISIVLFLTIILAFFILYDFIK